jgi:hypothetical protein
MQFERLMFSTSWSTRVRPHSPLAHISRSHRVDESPPKRQVLGQLAQGMSLPPSKIQKSRTAQVEIAGQRGHDRALNLE